MDAIATVGLSKRYGRGWPAVHLASSRPAGVVHALHEISITVREGEMFGFLGPNGAA